MNMNVGIARRLGFGLSRDVWLVQLGVFLTLLGYGAVLPFEVIYLTDGRGFSLSVAGLIVGVIFVAAVVVAPCAGPLIDRFGWRATTAGAGVALAGLEHRRECSSLPTARRAKTREAARSDSRRGGTIRVTQRHDTTLAHTWHPRLVPPPPYHSVLALALTRRREYLSRW